MNIKSIFSAGEGISNFQLRLRQLDIVFTHAALIIAIVFFGALQINGGGIVMRYVPLFVVLTIWHVIYIKFHHRIPAWVTIPASLGFVVWPVLMFLGLAAQAAFSQRIVNDDIHGLAAKAGLPDDPTYPTPKDYQGNVIAPNTVPQRTIAFTVYSIIPTSIIVVLAFESLLINLALLVGVCVSYHRRNITKVPKSGTREAYKLDG